MMRAKNNVTTPSKPSYVAGFREVLHVTEAVELAGGPWVSMTVIETDVPAVLAHRFCWQGRTLVLLHNLDDALCEVAPTLTADERARGLIDLFGNQLCEPHGEEPLRFTLAGSGYRRLRLQGRVS